MRASDADGEVEVKTTVVKLCYMTPPFGNLCGARYYEVAVGRQDRADGLAEYVTDRFQGVQGVFFSSVCVR